MLLAVGILLLIACAVGGYFYWDYSQKNTTQQGEESLKKLDDDSLAIEVNKLVDAKKYDEAQELVKYQEESSSDPAKIVMQVRLLNEQGKNDEALKLLRDAAAKKDDNAYFYTGHEARILALMGDKQGAIAKYTEAKELATNLVVKSEDQHAELERVSLMADYQTEIDNLKGQQ